MELSQPILRDPAMKWSNYVRGIARELQEVRGYELRGAQIAIGGNVPQGGGLSSSAALEVSVATALNHLNALSSGPKDLALIGLEAEWCVCVCECECV
jgi:galactokinase